MSRTRTNSANTDILDNEDVQPETVETTETDNTDSTDTSVELAKFDVSSLIGMNDDEVRETYSNGSRATKGAIRAHYANVMKTALAAKDAVAAFAANDLIATLVTIPVKSDVVVDYAQIVANRIVSLRNALNRLETDGPDNVPEGVVLDMNDVSDLIDNMDETVKSDLVDLSIASVKWGTSGPKRSVGAHVAEWAASVPSGTFATCATIGNFRSTVYGTDRPSDGAIAAHLFPTDAKTGLSVSYGKSDLTGVIPVEAVLGSNARGARKI